MIHAVRAGIVGLILAVLLAAPGRASPVVVQAGETTADGDVTMRVTPALNGHVKYGEWLPLHVHLTNEGGNLNAEVQADVRGSTGRATYAAPAPLPTGAEKEILLYVQPPSFAQVVHVRLVSGGEVLAEDEIDVVTHPRSTYIVGALASAPDAFAPLNGLMLADRRQVQLVPLTLETFPSRMEALRSLDSIIVAGLDTSAMTPAQGEALQTWVEAGGRVLIGGGVGARRTLTGLPEPLRPVELGETIELDSLDNLADFVGQPIQVPGPFPATVPEAIRGFIRIVEQETPMLVQTPLGEGWVGYLALDPAGSPFDAWAGTLPFWQRLLEPGAGLETNAPTDIPARVLETEQMSYALSNLPVLELPSVRWMTLLLGLYIILVGPINYLVLRRLRRLALAWVTIPALTLLFSVGGYGLGYSLRGNDVVINQISILPLYAGSDNVPARVYVGIFSPTRHAYDLRVEGDALISPMSRNATGRPSYQPDNTTLDVLQGEPALIRDFAVNQWAMQSFLAEVGVEDVDGMVDADLAIEEERVHGTLRNPSEYALEEVILLIGHRFARLGDVGAGQEVTVDAALSGGARSAPLPWALFQDDQGRGLERSQREMMLRQSILEAFFRTQWGAPVAPTNPMLLAWSDAAPLEIEVDRVRASRHSVMLIALQMPLPVVEGKVVLPPASLSARVLTTEGEAGTCGPSDQIYMGRGEATLEYVLPANVRHLDPSRLTLRVIGDGGGWSDALEVAFYNWMQADWVELETLERDTLQVISDPARFVDRAGGGIRLRAGQDDANTRMCYEFRIGLEGEIDAAVEEVFGD